MSAEKSPAVSVALPGSEGLRPFSFSGANKFELQTANDLFELYGAEKDPRTLGKINALRLDMMKRAAEAEIAKLTPARTREQIETEMRERQVSKAQANDELAYVLVTYLSNVEKLEAERRAEVAKTERLAKERAETLKTEVDSKTPGKAGKTKGGKAPEKEEAAGEKPEEANEKKNAEFIERHRARIDALLAKLPEGEAKTKIPQLLSKPNGTNVREIQTLAWLKGDGPRGADGKFGKHTLETLEKLAGIASEKPAVEPAVKPVAEKRPAGPATIAPEDDVRERARLEETGKSAESEIKERENNERILAEYQREALKNLKPIGHDKYVVRTSFMKDGFTGSAFFKFDARKWEWLWNAFNDPDTNSRSKGWNRVEDLREFTAEGVTAMRGFGFSESAQETANAILLAQEKAKETWLKLKSPSAGSWLVDKIPT